MMKKVKTRLTPGHLIFALAVLLGLSAFLFFSFYREAKEEAVRHMNSEQILYAKQAAGFKNRCLI